GAGGAGGRGGSGGRASSATGGAAGSAMGTGGQAGAQTIADAAGPADADARDGDRRPVDGLDAGVDADAGTTDAADARLPIEVGPPVPGTVTVDLGSPGRTVPKNFAGISVEWPAVQTFLGDGNGGLNAPAIQLLRNFEADGTQVHVRIGGNSTDRTWLARTDQTAPMGASVSVTPTFLATLNEVHKATGTPLILGVNLGLGDPAIAAAQLEAYAAAFAPGVVEAWELGNEPDLYVTTGRRVAPYGVNEYLADAERFLTSLAPLIMNRPLFALPAAAGGGYNIGTIINAQKPRMNMVTVHGYPFSVCGTNPTPPMAADLLSDRATVNFARSYAARLQLATAAGLSFRLGEMNSAACGGAANASDVFAAGLWGAHVMFELASLGVVGLNFHTAGRYSPFVFRNGAPAVQGLYYGMLLFSRTTAAGGKLLPVQVTSTARVRAWATIGTDKVVRIAILNESIATPADLSIKLSAARKEAEVVRLLSPALDAKTGITFGGQTFDGSLDGKPLGTTTRETIQPAGGAYTLRLAQTSGVVLILK
ncbi:MAG TPA: glycosyl hydrolase family 79 C-terminal domain-containing protein, partial [Polyangia bacterium]